MFITSLKLRSRMTNRNRFSGSAKNEIVSERRSMFCAHSFCRRDLRFRSDMDECSACSARFNPFFSDFSDSARDRRAATKHGLVHVCTGTHLTQDKKEYVQHLLPRMMMLLPRMMSK